MFLQVFGAETLLTFVLDHLFKYICMASALEDKGTDSSQSKEQACLFSSVIQIISPSMAKFRQVCSQPIVKILIPWVQCSLPITQTHYMCRIFLGSLHITSMEFGHKENWGEHEDHAGCCAVNNKVLWLWPNSLLFSASIHEMYQANWLAWMYGEILELSQFLIFLYSLHHLNNYTCIISII